MRTPAAIADELVTTFERIERERMHDVPVLNSALSVEAVAFERIDDDIVGVLLTPWFMNLMLLPADPEGWSEQIPGEKLEVALPGGSFEFICAYEDGIGAYRMCSLFSPVFEFEDQDTAVATAAAVMDGVLNEPAPEAETPAPPRRLSRRELFRGLAAAE